MDGVEDHGAILDRAADGPHTILRPREHHPAVAAHASEGWPERAEPTLPRGRHDRAGRLRADAERDAPGRRRRRWPGRRSTRAAAQVPRIVRAAAVPLNALS